MSFLARKMPSSLRPGEKTQARERRAITSRKRCTGVTGKTKPTFWSLGGDLSSLLSQTRREDRTSPWLSEQLPSGPRAPDPPDRHIWVIMTAHHGSGWTLTCYIIFKWHNKKKSTFAYHSVTSIIAEDHNVDRRRVIGDTDSSFLGFIFPAVGESYTKSESGDQTFPDCCYLGSWWAGSPVVIADSSRESTSTDPVAHDMDPLAQPRLDSKQWHEHKCQREKLTRGAQSDYFWMSFAFLWSPWIWK